MGSRRGRLLAAAAAAALLAVASCDLVRNESQEEMYARAGSLGEELLEGGHASAPDAARRVVGGDVAGGGTLVEVMRAGGDTRDGTVVLRVTVVRPGTSRADDERASACFRYELRDEKVPDADRVRCPDGPPLPIEPPRPSFALPPDSAERLTTFLRRLAPAERRKAATLETPLDLTFPPDVTTGVAVAHGYLGVAAGAAGECVLARVRVTGARAPVKVWRAPAGTGCRAAAAARGEGAPR